MYQILVDDQIFYDSRSEAYPLVEAVLQQEMNKAGSLTLRFYYDYPGYDLPKKLKSTIKVLRDGEMIFKGRVLNETIGFYGDKLLTCEGQLAFLNDSIVRPYQFKGTVGGYIRQLLENHRNESGTERDLFISDEEVERLSGILEFSSEGYVNTWEELQDKLIEPYGGYLLVHEKESQVYYFQTEAELKDYLNERAANNSQEICLGENLLDLSQVLDGGDIATAIIPVGKKLEDGQRVTILSRTGGQRDYVYNPEAVELYGFICKVVEYDEIDDPETLERTAEADLVNNLYSLEVLNVSAVDLSVLESEVEAFQVGAYVNVKSEKHGLNIPMLISKMQVDLLNPSGNKLTLGLSRKAYIEKQLEQNQYLEKETIKIKDPVSTKIQIEKVEGADKEGEIQTTYSTSFWKNEEKIHLSAEKNIKNTGLENETNVDGKIKVELTADEMEMLFETSETSTTSSNKCISLKDGGVVLWETNNGSQRMEANLNEIIFYDSEGNKSASFTPASLHVPNVETTESMTIAGKLRISRRNNNSIDINVV